MDATPTGGVVTLALPYTPLGALFRFVPLPWPFLAMVSVILAAYGSAAEIAKRLFYRSGRPAAPQESDDASAHPGT